MVGIYDDDLFIVSRIIVLQFQKDRSNITC
jgi:hypothetical protein